VKGGHFAQQNVGVVPRECAIKKPLEFPPDLNDTERKIVEAIGTEPMPIDDVITKVQLPVHLVRATIAVLQMKKLVCQVEGNQVRRNPHFC